MLTKVTAYSQWSGVDPLVLTIVNRSEDDLFETRNIDGLGSVKAEVNTTPLGSLDQEAYIGSNIGKRNLVLTIGLDPDWDEWTVTRLRRLLDKYFLPKQSVRFVFETMEFSPVEISGSIESNEPNIFSKDPEQIISIICPAPDFVSVDPVLVTGETIQNGVDPIVPTVIDYQGSVETGINIKIDGPTSAFTGFNARMEDPALRFVTIDEYSLESNESLVINSIPGQKYIRVINDIDPEYVNLLNKQMPGSTWLTLRPGSQEFMIWTDAESLNWTLTYHERFRSL